MQEECVGWRDLGQDNIPNRRRGQQISKGIREHLRKHRPHSVYISMKNRLIFINGSIFIDFEMNSKYDSLQKSEHFQKDTFLQVCKHSLEYEIRTSYILLEGKVQLIL